MEHPQIRFGPFTFDAAGRRLLRDGTELRVGSRALDLLDALLERPGEVVDHATLVARAWPHSVVEETSLRVQMSALRRVLGDGDTGVQHIATVSGRGYCFVASLAAPAAAPAPPASAPAPAMAPALVRTIGREALVAELVQRLPATPLISLVGPGGVGKTTVARATAERCRSRFPGGIAVADLADCRDGAAVAQLLGQAVQPLGRAPGLLLVETCEHVIEAAAEQAHALLARMPGLHVMATSREPLGVPGEHLQRVPGLGLPADGTAGVLASAAVQLFIERASALDDTLDFGPATHALLAQLCQRLDGLPLAIELAAARADAMSLGDLVHRAADPLPMLTRGRRTASARHRSLQASLDWSHALLGPLERTVLRRLSVFPGPFTLDAAAALLCRGGAAALKREQVVDALVQLVARSWLQAMSPAGDAQYRMLATTRAYARACLAQARETDLFDPPPAAGTHEARSETAA
ncbi:ATP-binding protein [Rubrivivax sp. RP6-9]|uniref:ATP-binding protein n=1 Tax=Rubrivivax sp. RP6-9 TaxID=3415750 RepID=UPI003CC60E6A